MTGSNNSSTRSPWTSPLAVMVLVLVGLIAACASIEGALLRFVLFRIVLILSAVLPGLVLALACMGLGDVLVRPSAHALTKLERTILAFACGLGLMSCVAGALGFTGFLSQALALVAVAAGLVTGLPLWKALARPAPGHPAVSSSVSTTVLVGLVGVVSVMLGVFALTPPLIFDVTEYHLGAWTTYQQQGAAHFVPMPYNFYARFPFPVEALYYLGLSLNPAFDTAPKIFNTLSILACSGLGVVMVRRAGCGRNFQLLAALAIITLPVMLEVSVDAMIDAPVALLVASAAWIGLLLLGEKNNAAEPAPSLIIPALFLMATALTSKYTVAQIYLAPWCILFFPVIYRYLFHHRILLVTAVLITTVPIAIWFSKNIVFYGNPLEPFFVKWFRPGDLIGIAREKFYIDSHFPQSFLSISYWTTLLPRLHEFTWLYLGAALLALKTPYQTHARRLLVFCLVSFLFWNLVRESQDRFLLPAMMFIVVLAIIAIASLPSRACRWGAASVVLFFVFAQVTAYALKLRESQAITYLLEFYPGPTEATDGEKLSTPRQAFLEKNLGDLGKIITMIEQEIPQQDARILLVYEARPYLFSHQTAYNVVWDHSVLLDTIRHAETVDQAWQKIADAGYTHILVNRQELLRYIQQYARPSQLRKLGLASHDDPRAVWNLTPTPEDLYPSFYNDPDWPRLRPHLHAFLKDIDARAIIRSGISAPAPGAQPIDITVSPAPVAIQ